MAATGKRVDPFSAYRFMVEIGGISYGMFRECSGISSEVGVTEHNEGGSGIIQKIPGRARFANIVLRYGLTDTRDLYDWHLGAVQGQVERRNGSIVLLDRAGQEQVRWNFVQGWPSRWTGPALNAGSDEVAVETLEIAHEGIVRA